MFLLGFDAQLGIDPCEFHAEMPSQKRHADSGVGYGAPRRVREELPAPERSPAIDADQALVALEAFEPAVRRVIYTTSAIEALSRQLRKAVKTKGHFPTEDAARKLIYLAIQNAVPQWTRKPGWTKALLEWTAA